MITTTNGKAVFKRPQKIYGLRECEKLISRYYERGGDVYTIEEGVLGLGLMILTGHNLKTTIIKEVYLNCWSSGHTVRMYNECPEKYRKMIEEL